MGQKSRLLEVDVVLIGVAIFLVSLGITTIASATLDDPNPALVMLWKKQLVSALIGLTLGAAVVFLDYRWLLKFSYVFYALGIIGLLLVYVPGLGVESHGARSWIDLPLVNYRLQTSEPAKLGLILALARHLSFREGRFDSLLSVVPTLILTAIPLGLILVQPDLGTAVILPFIALGMLYAAGLSMPKLLLLCAPALAAVPPALWRLDETLSGPACFFLFCAGLTVILAWNLRRWTRRLEIALFAVAAIVCFVGVSQYFELAWNHLRPHQQDRILVYLNPEGNEADLAWQVNQSKIAIGAGELSGQGWRQGTQSQQRFMSEKHTDFIFAVLAEERGFVGCMLLFGAFGLLFSRGLWIARSARNFGGTLLASAIVIMFASYVLFNLSITMGLLPVTGLPLPFISYGGSSILASLVAVGLLLNIRLRRYA